MEYYSAIKNSEILPHVTTRMNLEGVMLSEISQTEKTNTEWSHLYVESKKQKKTNKHTKLIENRKRDQGSDLWL